MLIKYSVIQVNRTSEGYEIVFPCNGKWYRLSWDLVPERFKQLYVVDLKLQGISVPDFLAPYNVDPVEIGDTTVDIDLSLCDEVPEDYPVSLA